MMGFFLFCLIAFFVMGIIVMATLQDILAVVTAQDTALDSVRELILGLEQKIADLLAGIELPEAVQAQVDAVFAQAVKNSAEIAEALATNVVPPPVEPAP